MNMKNNRVVIVGAGMAGLTAAAYLARENYDVLVFDKNERTGGLLGTFESNGFLFDSGPRALVNSGIVKPILKDLGIDWEYLENKITLGVEDHLFTIDSMDDLDEYQKILIHLYPESHDDINRIISIMKQLSEYTKVLYEFDNPNFGNLLNDRKYIFKKLIPWTFRLLHVLRKFRQFTYPMEGFLKKITDDQSLIDILIQHFFRNTPTYFALGYFYVYLDYFYPKGGTGALNNLLREKILGWGGEFHLNKPIAEVIPSESKVIDSEGCSYQYDHLVWAADLKTLYRILNPIGLDDKTTRSIEITKNRILSARGAESVLILYMAVNRPPAYFRENGGCHLFYTPSKQGLGETNQEERQSLIKDFDKKSKQEIIAWLERFLDLNTYEISIPALRDATLAPEGQTGLMISCLFDYQVIRKIEEAGWYDECKQMIENRIINIISQTIYRDIDRDILFKFTSTPLTINKISGSSEGAITGWSFETEPPVVNQLKDIPKSVLTPLNNIYQAGQWAYSPAGVPIAMLTGWYATQEIIRLSKKRDRE